MARRELFLGGLSRDTRRRDLEDIFERYGKLTRCDVKYVSGKGHAGTAYGFVAYDDERDAEDAVKAENGRKICGVPVMIEFSKSKPWNSIRYSTSRYDRRHSRSRSRSRRRSRSRSRSKRSRDRRRDRSRSRSRSRTRSRDRRDRRRRDDRSRSRDRKSYSKDSTKRSKSNERVRINDENNNLTENSNQIEERPVATSVEPTFDQIANNSSSNNECNGNGDTASQHSHVNSERLDSEPRSRTNSQ